MKTLYLLRHAEASLREPGREDFDRALNGSGREAAPRVGQFIRERKLRVDLILCSHAVRARQTASLVKESAGLPVELLYDERVYEADAARLLEVVSQAAESADALLLVGHNPGLEELLKLLTGETRRMQTAALACVALRVEKWVEARSRAGRLEWVVRPGGPAED